MRGLCMNPADAAATVSNGKHSCFTSGRQASPFPKDGGHLHIIQTIAAHH